MMLHNVSTCIMLSLHTVAVCVKLCPHRLPCLLCCVYTMLRCTYTTLRFAEQHFQITSALTHWAEPRSGFSLLSMLAPSLSATKSSTSYAHHAPTATSPPSSCALPVASQQLQGSLSISHRQGCYCRGFLPSGCKPLHHRYATRGSCCGQMGRPQRWARCLASQHEDITDRHGPLQGTAILPNYTSIHLSACPSIRSCAHPLYLFICMSIYYTCPMIVHAGAQYILRRDHLGDQSCTIKSPGDQLGDQSCTMESKLVLTALSASTCQMFCQTCRVVIHTVSEPVQQTARCVCTMLLMHAS